MKRILPIFLAFFILLVNNPANSQNTGPVAPEAMSFEPVDATDMVNLVTGDMSYVLPLITVPGPDGGYPLSLSYHGGITMDQESSWVGLGWTVNPGAINRDVAGFPDDWNGKDVLGISYVSNAGEFKRNFVGITAPLYMINPALPSIGLNASWGTHWSFGGSIGYGLEGDLQAGVGFSVGDDDISMSVSAGSQNGLRGSMTVSSNGVGFGVDLGSIGASTFLSDDGIHSSLSFSQMEIDFNSEGVSYESNVGFTYISLAKANKMDYSVREKGWQVNLILLNFGHYQANYWLYKETVGHVYGSIYAKNSLKQKYKSYWGDQTMSYFMDVHNVNYDIETSTDGDRRDIKNNLMFMSYDNYNVSAQGLSGSIIPQLHESGLLFDNGRVISKQGDEMEDDEVIRYCYNIDELNPLLTKPENQIYFNFIGENSSYLKVAPVTFSYNSTSGATTFEGGDVQYSITKNGQQLSFYNDGNKRKGNGKYIEWFTNKELTANDNEARNSLLNKGFIETESIAPDDDPTRYPNPRNNPNYFDPDGIGAYSITTEDGKTYHYSLPVYQFEEIMKQYQPNGIDFIEQRKLQKYAQSWLLTAITGPDYVDRGGLNGMPNGKIDNDDYGYWVKFEYGKWSDGYIWQRPFDNPNNKFPFIYGRKQIYYLNSINTRTHTALFVKSIRDDGMGKMMLGSNSEIKETDNGEISPGNYMDCTNSNPLTLITSGNDGKFFDYTRYVGSIYHNQEFNINENTKILKLEKILILKNSDASINLDQGDFMNSIKSSITYTTRNEVHWIYRYYNDLTIGSSMSTIKACEKKTISFNSQISKNILDIKDIETLDIESKALKIVKFNYDYSLCHNSPNSMSDGQGKLTLKSIETLGKGNTKITPPYVFEYNIPENNTFDLQRKDLWGFDAGSYSEKSDQVNKPSVTNWSLKSILTPVGTTININYEPDTYIKEALYNGRIDYCIPTSATITNATNRLFKVVLPGSKSINKINDSDLVLLKLEYSVKLPNNGPVLPVEGMVYTYLPIYSRGVSNDLVFKMKFFDPADADPNVTLYSINVKEIIFIDRALTTNFGGGIRVKSVNVQNAQGKVVSSTFYDYSNPSFNGLTSGVTTYAPHMREYYVPFETEIQGPLVMYEYVKVISKDANNIPISIVQYNFEVPASPAGNYTLPTITLPNQLEVTDLQNESYNVTDGKKTFRSTLVKNNTAVLGRLLSMASFNAKNQLIQKQLYQYKTMAEIEAIKQGLDQETFLYNKRFTNWGEGHTSWVDEWSVNSSSRIFYPSVLKSVVTNTPLGEATTLYNDYDFYTGEASDITVVKANGDKINNTSVPAFLVPAYEKMGSKVYNLENKNMLSQKVENTMKKLKGTTWKTINTSIQTWNNKWNYRVFDATENRYSDQESFSDIWRKHKTYVWKGDVDTDGSYKDFETKKFDWTKTNLDDNNVNGWLKTSEVTRYNHYSMPLESKDVNGNYGATKMGNNYVIASASNTNYINMGATSFEFIEHGNDFGSEFLGSTDVNTLNYDKSHTGHACLRINANSNGPSYKLYYDDINGRQLIPGKTYRASVWVHSSSDDNASLSLVLNGLDDGKECHPTDIKYKKNKVFNSGEEWYLLTAEVKVPEKFSSLGTLGTQGLRISIDNVGASAYSYFDDLRFAPVDAGLTSYVYDQSTGNLTAILDNNNFAAKFSYDAAGRLISTYKETPQGFKKLSENKYNYKRSNYYIGFNYSPYFAKSGDNIILTANDAGSGATYNWNFGNGESGTGKMVQHQYNETVDKTYNVTLEVTEANSKKTVVNNTIFVDYVPSSSEIEIVKPSADEVISKSERNYLIQWNGFSGTVNIVAQPIFGSYTSIPIVSGHYGSAYTWDVASFNLSAGNYYLIISSTDGTISKNQKITIQ